MPTSKSQPRSDRSQPEIDILKALAVTAVILIHITTAHLFVFDKFGTWQANLNLFFNQIWRFSVPVFVALSGYGLAKSFNSKWESTSRSALLRLRLITDFYLRRVWRVLPWFFVASLTIYTAINTIMTFDKGLYEGNSLLKIFFWGKADYHLYFVPMIFQLYLLFPLLFILTRRFPWPVFILSLIWQIALYQNISQVTEIYGNYNTIWPDQQQYIWFYSWIFYFLLGIFLALRPGLASRSNEPEGQQVKKFIHSQGWQRVEFLKVLGDSDRTQFSARDSDQAHLRWRADRTPLLKNLFGLQSLFSLGPTNLTGLAGITLLIIGLFLSEVNMFSLLNSGIDGIVATRFTRLPVLLYSTSFILSGLSLGPLLLSYSPAYLLSLLVRLGRLSYLTYLFHTLVLRFFTHYTPILSRLPLVFTSIIVIATSFLFAHLIDRAAQLLGKLAFPTRNSIHKE